MNFKADNVHVDSRIRQLFFLQLIGVASIIVVVALHLVPSSAEEELRVVHADIHNLEMGLAGLRGDVVAMHNNIVAMNSTMHSAMAAILAQLRRNPT